MIAWPSATCSLHVTTVAPIHDRPGRYTVTFQGVRDIKVPREEPWGSSVCVNSQACAGAIHSVELQSGDTIRVTADRFLFSANEAI